MQGCTVAVFVCLKFDFGFQIAADGRARLLPSPHVSKATDFSQVCGSAGASPFRPPQFETRRSVAPAFRARGETHSGRGLKELVERPFTAGERDLAVQDALRCQQFVPQMVNIVARAAQH